MEGEQGTNGALTSLPAERTPLIGRDGALVELHERVRDHRVVTIAGLGGIGKTRLAVALAHELVHGDRRVAFVELVDVPDASVVIDEIADRLGVEVVPGAARYDGLVHRLAATPTVLLVDNFEHVIDAAPDVAALVEECAGLHVVVTSRRSLGIGGEHVFTVEPLAATTPAGAEAAPGVQLLLQRSNVASPSAIEVEAASRIVAGVGGLPLAIELAAFRARAIGVPPVHELLVADLALSGFHEPGAASERHGSLRECLQWTYRDLDEGARTVFRATGAFAGTFELADLRAVVGDRREAAVGLASLVEHHLVDRIGTDDGSARYTSIPPIREFARELLAGDPRCDEVVGAHANRYRTVAARIRAIFEAGGATEALAAFRREEANINRAVGTRQRTRRYDEAAAIACEVAKIACEMGREDRTSEWFRDLVRLADGAGTTMPFEARVWAVYGDLLGHTPDTAAAALAELDDVITRARAAGDDRAVLRGLDRMALSVLEHGDVVRAIAASGEGIELARRLQLPWPLAQLSTWHAMLLHIAGDIDGACRYGFDALRIARGLDDGRLIVRVGLLFAPMTRTPQMDEEQVPSLDACLETAREQRSVVDEMYVLMQLAVRAGFDDDPEVFALVRRGFELADLARAHVAELVLVLALAGAAFNRGDDDVAVALDVALRPEWVALSTVIPYAGLQRYEQIVERRRAVDPDRMDRLREAATASRWRDGLDLAIAYADRGPDRGAGVPPDAATLTPRELEVLAEIAEGRTNKEIARVLGLRPKTVMHHCAAIYRKLGVRTRAEAAATALRTGLLDRDH